MKKGQIVKSLSGHDKDIYHVVIKVECGCAYIADGRTRKSEKPKKKNIKHLQEIDEFIPDGHLTNRKIRNALHEYNFNI